MGLLTPHLIHCFTHGISRTHNLSAKQASGAASIYRYQQICEQGQYIR